MVDGVTELVGKSRRIPFVLHTNPSALEVSSTSGLIFLGHSYVLVPQMAPLDDTEIERLSPAKIRILLVLPWEGIPRSTSGVIISIDMGGIRSSESSNDYVRKHMPYDTKDFGIYSESPLLSFGDNICKGLLLPAG
ncbi:hypothetical protein Tco_1494217 [Tanacetum coccineum]